MHKTMVKDGADDGQLQLEDIKKKEIAVNKQLSVVADKEIAFDEAWDEFYQALSELDLIIKEKKR